MLRRVLLQMIKMGITEIVAARARGTKETRTRLGTPREETGGRSKRRLVYSSCDGGPSRYASSCCKLLVVDVSLVRGRKVIVVGGHDFVVTEEGFHRS